MTTTGRFSILVAVLLILGTPAWAKKNDPNITLEFLPQQAVAGAVATVSGAMLEQPAALELVDDRKLDDTSWLGTRTDDDDRRFELRATNDLEEFISEQLESALAAWGVQLEPGQSRTLRVRLLEARITENNQAVGATYNAVVRLAFSLHKGGGDSLVSATAFGDASRYGRKFSNANCNEVLSDAMLEAFADMVNNRALQDAWAD